MKISCKILFAKALVNFFFLFFPLSFLRLFFKRNILSYIIFYSIPCLLYPQTRDELIDLDNIKNENQISINLKNNKIIDGALLYIRDTALIVYSKIKINDPKGEITKKEINIIGNSQIENIFFPQKSNYGNGTVICAGIGFTIGFIGGSSSDIESKNRIGHSLFLGFLMSLPGALIGVVIDILSPKPAKIIYTENQKLESLKHLAYYKTEPEYLRKIK